MSMIQQCKFTEDTKNYLSCFYTILNEMIEGMDSAKLTNSISHNFIVQMIPHHRAAIQMSQNVLQYSICKPLEKIAKNIITSQTASINSMREVLQKCSSHTSTERDICLHQHRHDIITRNMFEQMNTACSDNNISADFMREMIPHHMGAVEMSKNTLRYEICPQLNPILQAIISSQEEGIREMSCLLGISVPNL